MIIAFANHKGGTGKTTTTINLGKALTNLGKKVLLVDLDPQGNLSFSLGIKESKLTIVDVLIGTKKIDDVVSECSGMDVIPSNVVLNKYMEMVGKTKDSKLLLKHAFEGINLKYDFVLIDCPPSLSVYTLNALNAADGLIIPMLLEILSIQGLDQILDEVTKIQGSTNPSLEVIGALGTIVNENRRLSTEVLAHIRDHYDVNVFNNHVRSNVKAAEAPSYATTVIDYAPTSTSARDYTSIANELLQIIGC
jgi:chromosome partitioning protein